MPPPAAAAAAAAAPASTPTTPHSAWARTKASASRTCGGALLPYSIISLSYILFTTTDGALRMIVLLHAYSLGFSALTLACVFAGYEAAGVIVNLLAGMAGARFGIKATMMAGLSAQLVALGALFACAKDLVKLGGKTVTKLVTPEEKTVTLFKLVSMITGELERGGKGDGDAERRRVCAARRKKKKKTHLPPFSLQALRTAQKAWAISSAPPC